MIQLWACEQGMEEDWRTRPGSALWAQHGCPIWGLTGKPCCGLCCFSLPAAVTAHRFCEVSPGAILLSSFCSCFLLFPYEGGWTILNTKSVETKEHSVSVSQSAINLSVRKMTVFIMLALCHCVICAPVTPNIGGYLWLKCPVQLDVLQAWDLIKVLCPARVWIAFDLYSLNPLRWILSPFHTDLER